MDDILRASGPGDLLALTPSLLGFHPRDSLVLLTVGEATTPFHARVDLPRDPVEVEEVVGHLAAVAGRHGVRRAALLVYGTDHGLAEAVAGELGRRLWRVRSRLVCAVRADPERWWWLDGAADDPGTPYDVQSHPWRANAVLEGRVVLPDRDAVARSLVGDDPKEQDRVRALVEGVADGLLGTGPEGRSHLVSEGRWVRERVRTFLDDGLRLDAPDVARLATLMGVSLEVRDVAWAEMRRDNAVRHVDLWRDLVRRAPDELRAAPAALLGFAAWLSGDGALAWCAVDCAQRALPGYSLAGLLSQALAGAVPPSAWQPVPADALTLFAPGSRVGSHPDRP